MKRTALTHTKMKRLMRALDIPQYAAVGLLESLWNLTARETPRGDIGKLSNEDIAVQLDWRGEPDSLMQALLTAGWLDVEEELRFIVHDWQDHADDGVDNLLARAGKTYANGQIPHMKRLTVKERTELLAQYPKSMGTESAQKRIKAHGERTALPLPLPLPKPLPKPEPMPKKEPNPSAVAEFVLPEWIDPEIWDTYLEVRASKGAKKTPRAWRSVVKQLAAYRARGHDPDAVLETSIRSNWTDVYEPKGAANGITQHNRGSQRVADQLEELRKAGVTFPAGVPEDGAGESSFASGGGHGRHAAGVVLEGSR